MKRYKIVHNTTYEFGQPVELKPHRLRLRPRDSHEMRIESSVLHIHPKAEVRWVRDVEDNSIAIAEFSQRADRLEIQSELIVEQYNTKPLDFVIDDTAVQFPFHYEEADLEYLAYYLSRDGNDAPEKVKQWVDEKFEGKKFETYGFLDALCQAIQQGFAYKVREEPGVQSPEETLRNGTGSCRDFSAFFMACVRYKGMAARFVSGYLCTPSSNNVPGATHAWAEVYIPGAGWKGFDPTNGNIAGSWHFPVAVARNPELVPPVEGTFFGAGKPVLTVGVWVTELSGG